MTRTKCLADFGFGVEVVKNRFGVLWCYSGLGLRMWEISDMESWDWGYEFRVWGPVQLPV